MIVFLAELFVQLFIDDVSFFIQVIHFFSLELLIYSNLVGFEASFLSRLRKNHRTNYKRCNGK